MTVPPSTAACPEKKLLIACARTQLPSEIEARIQEMASGPIDWGFLISAAADNSVIPLLNRNLFRAVADVPPSSALSPAAGPICKLLSDTTRGNTMRCLVLVAELIKIMDSFRSQGIQAIPYKGPALAAQAYGDVALREFDDLDIVLPQRDMQKANEVMVDLGYRGKYPWVLSPNISASLVPGEYCYREGDRRLVVELHTERTLRHFPVPPDLNALSRSLASVKLAGHSVPTFSAEDGLSILCVHGSKDFWERVSWIADIAELVQSHPRLDWDRVFQRAESLRANRMLHLGLALAVELLGANLPVDVLSKVQKDELALSMSLEIKQRHLEREWRPLTGSGRLRYRRNMVNGALDGWRYSLRLAVVPSEEDWSMLPLPRSLAPLYVALRPLRLLRKYREMDKRHPQPSA